MSANVSILDITKPMGPMIPSEAVLVALGHTGPPPAGRVWPRGWWCPTGALSMLPIHAPGHHPATTPRRPRGQRRWRGQGCVGGTWPFLRAAPRAPSGAGDGYTAIDRRRDVQHGPQNSPGRAQRLWSACGPEHSILWSPEKDVWHLINNIAHG